MLTKTDREFLLADEDYYTGNSAKQTRYERRQNIRNRIRETLLDFTLLFDHMPRDEQEKLFGAGHREWTGYEDGDLDDGARDTLAFILDNAGIVAHMRTSGTVHNAAADLFESAIARVGLKNDRHVTDVEPPKIESVSIRNVKRRLEEGDSEETAHSLGLLLQATDISNSTRGEIQNLLQEEIADDTSE